MQPKKEQSSSVRYMEVGEESIDQRLDNYLFTRLKGVPKSRIYRALREGEIRVNKKRVKPEYRLQFEDQVRIPPIRVAQAQEKMPPQAVLLKKIEDSIIYEDKSLIIINKPSGIASHGGSGINFGVIELLRHLRPKLKFLELAHRLDRETTGCLMLAKKPSILKELHLMLAESKIKKTYLAVVQGQWQGGQRRINAPLLKNQLRSGERIVTVHEEGKDAETIFVPLLKHQNATLVKANPLTGRTHQIRVHALHAGHPIIGDDKYGEPQRNLKVKHLLLHAASLEFVLPTTGERIAICACLDEEFQRVMRTFK